MCGPHRDDYSMSIVQTLVFVTERQTGGGKSVSIVPGYPSVT